MRTKGITISGEYHEVDSIAEFLNQNIFHDLETMTVVLTDEFGWEVSKPTTLTRVRRFYWYGEDTTAELFERAIVTAATKLHKTKNERYLGKVMVQVTLS